MTGYASVATVPTFQHLPYNDHLANLVVADLDSPGAPTFEEVQRVVHPFGTPLVRRKGVWEKVVKPLPPTMGEWTHYDHAPDGNPQSSDSLVGKVSGLQYMVSGHADSKSSIRLAGGLRLQGVKPSGPYTIYTVRLHKGPRKRQRRSILQPRVARRALPWVSRPKKRQP